ncbi:MAG TPA: hypothetical protein VLC71_03755 [Thermomonas sp.]|nr:hypothetical protein [Thermomonas sp.]
MSKLIALLQFLLALSGCSVADATHTNRIDSDREQLLSKAHVQDGVARFNCVESSSGRCHYTLYPDACNGKSDCQLAPLHRFAVARGESHQIAGLVDFRPCVATTAAPMRADCQPAATTKAR